MDITLKDIVIPEGFEAAGRFENPVEGDYILLDNNQAHQVYNPNGYTKSIILKKIKQEELKIVRHVIQWTKNGKIGHPAGGQWYITTLPIGWINDGWEFLGYSSFNDEINDRPIDNEGKRELQAVFREIGF